MGKIPKGDSSQFRGGLGDMRKGGTFKGGEKKRRVVGEKGRRSTYFPRKKAGERGGKLTGGGVFEGTFWLIQ